MSHKLGPKLLQTTKYFRLFSCLYPFAHGGTGRWNVSHGNLGIVQGSSQSAMKSQAKVALYVRSEIDRPVSVVKCRGGGAEKFS